jgi:coenzyme F420-reducing hydrogenase delta subunit/Pyruvate/2-oxoacid:ferredoxin oxidoreductase delta subunit
MPEFVRGQPLLRPLEVLMRRLDHGVRAVPESLNPFLQAGAVANTCFLIATITGILLLFFYVPSVHQAYDSMLAMDNSPWTSGLIRSLHRYSSDACMFFVLYHAVKIFVARRFTGPRWLAWITGMFLLVTLWFVGWLGYWLVWDDPLSRAFLTDSTVSSLLFFIVFFAHMLIPLAMGIALWLHIIRLARSRFLTTRRLTIWITVSLLIMSLAWPATASAPAQMQVEPRHFTMDWWFLMPLAMTDRLGMGMLWGILLIVGVLLMSVPWWMRRGKGRLPPAHVEEPRCNACLQCYTDCPYNAIAMVPRSDDKKEKYKVAAKVNPALCVGCGICSASCDSVGIDIPWFDLLEKRKLLEGWLEEEPGVSVALACVHSAGGSLSVDTETGRCKELPDHRVLKIPCAGWVHAMTVERAQRKGAGEVVVVACGEGACAYREGDKWLTERMASERKPALRRDKADPEKIHLLRLHSWQKRELISRATTKRRGPLRMAVATAVLALVAVVTIVVSELPYTPPTSPEPILVVSFKHPGAVRLGRLLTPEEKAKYPAYMKRERVIERRRNPVRMQVRVDGKKILEKTYEPTGLWGDGNSFAIERLRVPAGTHRVEVWIGETADPEEWTRRSETEVTFSTSQHRVVLFDRVQGFTWH